LFQLVVYLTSKFTTCESKYRRAAILWYFF